mmetsp:Transcript_9355/g.14019  ORF Transcript_9355/g.14019 Transcript_9355/m.14019 type:complete len:86 (+) Transcript_9355:122-379(+)
MLSTSAMPHNAQHMSSSIFKSLLAIMKDYDTVVNCLLFTKEEQLTKQIVISSVVEILSSMNCPANAGRQQTMVTTVMQSRFIGIW